MQWTTRNLELTGGIITPALHLTAPVQSARMRNAQAQFDKE
jgi:hypothetical protein